jgi:hypothetical protein
MIAAIILYYDRCLMLVDLAMVRSLKSLATFIRMYCRKIPASFLVLFAHDRPDSNTVFAGWPVSPMAAVWERKCFVLCGTRFG